MSEVRMGPDGRMAIVAYGRVGKPRGTALCAFCPGQEGLLPESYFPEPLRSEARQRGIRAVGNKYPIVTPDSAVPSAYAIFGGQMPANGRHVVIIETDAHDLDPLADSREARAYYGNLAWAYAQTLALMRKEGYVWGAIGKNRNGRRNGKVINAGASQEHPHSQGISMDYLRREIPANMARLEHWTYGDVLPGCGTCLSAYDSLFSRQLERTHRFVSFVDPTPDPYPFDLQFRVLSLTHMPHFEALDDEGRDEFAGILYRTMRHLGRYAPGTGFNFALRNGPWRGDGDPEAGHFTFDIYLATEKNQRTQGILPHIIGASVVTTSPEALAMRIKQP